MQSDIPLLVEHCFVSKDQRPLLARQVLLRCQVADSLHRVTILPNIYVVQPTLSKSWLGTLQVMPVLLSVD